MFLSSENYRFFLQKYHEPISPVADTFCYCLMPNHFHLILNSHETKAILETLEQFYKVKELPYQSTKGKEDRDSIVLYQSLSNFSTRMRNITTNHTTERGQSLRGHSEEN